MLEQFFSGIMYMKMLKSLNLSIVSLGVVHCQELSNFANWFPWLYCICLTPLTQMIIFYPSVLFGLWTQLFPLKKKFLNKQKILKLFFEKLVTWSLDSLKGLEYRIT